MRQNAAAWELWLAVQTQWRAGAMGIIGLDYNSLYAEAARLEIDLNGCMMSKIKCLEQTVLEKMMRSGES